MVYDAWSMVEIIHTGKNTQKNMQLGHAQLLFTAFVHFKSVLFPSGNAYCRTTIGLAGLFPAH